MRCTEVRPLFPLYLDGAVTGMEMHALSEHMGECTGCQSEYRKLENTRLLVSSLGRKLAPPDLGMRIRVAVSRQRSRSFRNIFQSYAVRLENALNSFMLPATAGIVSAVVFFGVLIGFFVPAQVVADDGTRFYTPARVDGIYAEAESQVSLDAPLVIETDVDATGRAQGYRVISGRVDEKIRTQLNRALLFTIFEPAQSFGLHVPAKVVMSFAYVNVQG
jgi:hypothetical protein